MDIQEVTLKQIDDMKAACEDYIKVAEALNRLRTNEDFKLVFEEKYTKEYAIRTVGLLGDGSYNPHNNRKDSKEELYDSLIGISRFQTYMRAVEQMAIQAEKQLMEIHEAETEYYKNSDETVQ